MFWNLINIEEVQTTTLIKIQIKGSTMQIQIGIDIVLILAFSAYLYFITGWNGKNKAASIKQFLRWHFACCSFNYRSSINHVFTCKRSSHCYIRICFN
ncbi:hypothetical protein B9X62_15310 [Acinetobacter pittii]|nr:hypothetical protein B9X62_15310 [Acinetobacter pittii]